MSEATENRVEPNSLTRGWEYLSLIPVLMAFLTIMMAVQFGGRIRWAIVSVSLAVAFLIAYITAIARRPGSRGDRDGR